MTLDATVSPLPFARQILILITAVLSATVYITVLLVAATTLPQIQGAMSATSDEISWVITFNILATAIGLPMTGWLADRFGRRRVMVVCMGCFVVSTFMCGSADSLESLIVWRFIQGFTGAPILPLAQTSILATFPRSQHGPVLAVFGMGVVVGPVIGPTLGGWIAEIYGWRWVFYMFVPPALMALVGIRFVLRPDGPTSPREFDWIGFLTLSSALSCVQLVMSRGQRVDWFSSTEIVVEAVLGVVAFYLFIVHSLTCRRPFLDLSLLLNRNYALGVMLVTIYGMLNFTPTVLLPPLLQLHAGYPDSVIGIVIGSRGIGGTIGFFAAMFVGRIDGRVAMSTGFLMQAVAGWWLMTINLDVSAQELFLNGVLQGLSIGIIWVPLSVASFATLDAKQLPEATSVFHVMRNIGSSFFISLCVAEVIRTTGINYSRMAEFISPYNEILSVPSLLGVWNPNTVKGLSQLSKEINRQAAMLGYIKAFGLYTVVSAAAIPLILLVSQRRVRVT